MPFNPYSRADRDELFSVIAESRRAHAHFRRSRYQLISEYAGSNYSTNRNNPFWTATAGGKTFVNLLFRTADLYTQLLAATRPQVSVTSPHLELMPFAYHFQQALNNLIAEIRFEEQQQRIVLDAFFKIGICKIYNAEGAQTQIDRDVWIDVGQPYAEFVSLDDVTLDASATMFRKMAYVEHCYDVPLDSLRDERFNQKVVRELYESGEDRGLGSHDERRAEDISRSEAKYDYRKIVRLREVWLPFEGLICTWPEGDSTTDEPLQVVEWTGPEGGPYEFLTFSDVPDNSIPVSPAENLYNLHLLANSILRKMANQARKAKTNPIYDGAAAKDAERLRTARDLEFIKVNSIDRIKYLTVPGVDQKNLGFYFNLVDEFNKSAGNPELLAGIAAQSPTATQDSIINQNSNKRLEKMQTRVVGFLERVFRKLGWLLWQSPKEIPMVKQTPVGPVQSMWRGKEEFYGGMVDRTREGDFLDYNFAVEPYSLGYQSPQQKFQTINSIVQNPLMVQLAQQQGGRLDVQEYMRVAAEKLGVNELNQLFVFDQPPMLDRPGPAEMPQSPVTERHNVRHNAPNQENAQRQQMMQLMNSGEDERGAA